jgi:Suppressor of fused protein (SUFU)
MEAEPTDRMKRLHHYLAEHRWGEPSDIVVYDGSRLQPPRTLDRVHVAIWDAGGDCDVTTYATLGMSENCLPGAEYRAELTLGCRGQLGPSDRRGLATFVANVTEYPFMYGLKLDWWERLKDPGSIPAFPGCTQLLLAPMFGDDEFLYFPEPDNDVKMLSLVPITPQENHLLAEHGRQAFLDYWEQSGVDIFAPRAEKNRGA